MATITSTQTGDWHATGTWVGGAIPANNDLVVIAHGHKVTISTDIQSAITDNVTIDGNLHFADGGKMHLNGRMTVKNTSHSASGTGEFVDGTAASGSLLSMVGGTEIKISGNNSAQHGIQVDARRWCGVQIDGGEPTLKTELNGNHDCRATYLTVDDSANFAVGDLISIYKREEDFRLANDECFWVHDVDTDNHRIYFRQFVYPKVKRYAPVVESVSGATIKVDDASVFRVGYIVVFGTGNNRNVLTITDINVNSNIITFGSTVDNDPSLIGDYVYQTGTEKYHLSDSHVRRTSSCMTNTFSGAASLRTINVNNAADFSAGDKIYIEACGDDSYQYASGSETNVWRHHLVYTISSISGLTITVDRDILYDGKNGGLITRMTRDVVIKACAANGDDVAYADQDTARVFFNVKYWTSNTWSEAPTRRVKIKYVQFEGLGYNTADSTNFRAGVNIAGYNGYYDTKITGSAADNSTIHSTNGVSQTGENYLDGCSYTGYNLCSNSTRDGDSYPGICIRHPYGMVSRNHVSIGAGRGIWHWSTQYYIKTHGHISAACNYGSMVVEGGYERLNEVSYCYLRMAEDYGLMMYNLGGQTDGTTLQHMDVQYQNSYALYAASSNVLTIRRLYCDKYRYTYIADRWHNTNLVLDSRLMPNHWDASSYIYGSTHTPNYDPDQIRHYTASFNQSYTSSATNQGRMFWVEHGFREGEMVEQGPGITKLDRHNKSVSEYIVSPQGNPQLMTKILVPANCVVKIKSTLKINDADYDGAANTVSDNAMPVLMARSRVNCGFAGRHGQGVVTDSGSVRTLFTDWHVINSSDHRAGIKNSTEAKGKILQSSFVEYVAHTSTSQGAWEVKELTVAAQYNSYELTYGYYVDNHDITPCGFKALPIEIILSKASPAGSEDVIATGSSKKSINTAFDARKKRISGRI